MDNKDKIIELLRQELSTMEAYFSETVARLEACFSETEALLQSSLSSTVVLLDEKSALLEAALIRIAELERILILNSKNSSKPPSTDVFIKPQSLRAKGINKNGGQAGHEGHTLRQVAQPDSIIYHDVTTCQHCQKDLTQVASTSQIKRQVFEIPEPKFTVVEHQAVIKQCPCGHLNTAPFPSNITAPVQYGKSVESLVVYLSNQQLIPLDRLQQLCKDLCNLSISQATLGKMNINFAQKASSSQQQVLETLKQAPVKHVDESSLKICNKTQWFHVISNELLTHYRVASRGNVLTEVVGHCVHDHFKAYFSKMEKAVHSLCNAHHLRELQGLEEIEKEPWSAKMSRLLNLSCSLKNRGKSPPYLTRIFRIYDGIVAEGLLFHESQPALVSKRTKRRRGHNLLIRFRDFKDAVLRFTKVAEVPFTNNQAEQDIRMVKLKQKISGGFRTKTGADNFCIVRGFISTARKQQKNILQAIYAIA